MRTALVVDDEPDFGRIVKRILEPAGFSVELAGSAEEGWDKLQQAGGFDIFLVDWNLPGKSGIEFCSRVREDSRFGHLPLVLLTVRNLPDEQIKGLKESGADLYVTKPILPAELLARVESLLSNLEK